MQFHINGDGNGLEMRLQIRWRALGALLAAPVVTQLGRVLGWW